MPETETVSLHEHLAVGMKYIELKNKIKKKKPGPFCIQCHYPISSKMGKKAFWSGSADKNGMESILSGSRIWT
jgi:hypothetical protein